MRDARKLVRDKQALWLLERGGAPDRPLVVSSAALVDVRARSLPGPLCEGEYVLDEHTAARAGERSVRIAHVTCRRCGVSRRIYFCIDSPLPS